VTSLGGTPYGPPASTEGVEGCKRHIVPAPVGSSHLQLMLATQLIDFWCPSIHYLLVMRVRFVAHIAAVAFMVLLSLGFGAQSAAAHGVSTDRGLFALSSSAAPGCNRSPEQRPCGPTIPNCAIGCPTQGLMIAAMGLSQVSLVVAVVQYTLLSDLAPGHQDAPSPYPPRFAQIS
jgi:hypothetical protein